MNVYVLIGFIFGLFEVHRLKNIKDENRKFYFEQACIALSEKGALIGMFILTVFIWPIDVFKYLFKLFKG